MWTERRESTRRIRLMLIGRMLVLYCQVNLEIISDSTREYTEQGIN